jgi:hypothetical protein
VVNHLAFSPDGRHLVACLGGPNGIRVYETEGFEEIAAARDYGGDSYWAAFDREGRLVTSSEDGRIRLYEAGFNLSKSESAPSGEPFGVAFSPDGAQIAVGYADSTRVDVLDGRTLAPLFEPDTTGADNGSLSKVAWSADGRFLYAGGQYPLSGASKLRRWADGGRGVYEDIALSQDTITDLRPLKDGGLAFGAQGPSLGVLGEDAKIRWRQRSAQGGFSRPARCFRRRREGRTRQIWSLARSGCRVRPWARRLTLDPELDPSLVTARTEAPGLEIADWKNEYTPTVNGKRLPLEQYGWYRSLAIAPDGKRFLLGTEWRPPSLRPARPPDLAEIRAGRRPGGQHLGRRAARHRRVRGRHDPLVPARGQ